MRAKDMIIDFVNLSFFIALVSFCIIFFTQGDNLKNLWEIIKGFAPVLVFILVFYIKSKLNQVELKRRTREDDLEILLRLSFMDKILLDVILFSSPIIILLLPFLTGTPNLTDIFQALITFSVLYFWQKYLFSKTY